MSRFCLQKLCLQLTVLALGRIQTQIRITKMFFWISKIVQLDPDPELSTTKFTGISTYTVLKRFFFYRRHSHV